MSKNVLITGANRGIGLALSQLYSRRGDNVYAVCRHTSKELEQLPGVKVIEGIDVSNCKDSLNLKKIMAGINLDILINNAGILTDERLGDIDFENVESQFEVNAIGPLKTTQSLLDNLSAGSKVAMVTSRMGSISDNGSGGFYGYRMSKAALNAASMSLSLDLVPREIAVAILHPGYVQTAMVNNAGDISADEAAKNLTQRIDELSMQNTGTFWHANGEVLPW